jgi:predicted dehydrogenase
MAILGAGGIAGKMAYTIDRMEQVESYAIGARDIERAKEFAKEYHIEKAYGSYEEMLRDTQIELVYIATPHSHHYQHAMMCLNAGKHVLCEKAFTCTAEQAKKLVEVAREKKLLLAEAMWIRYLPLATTLREVLDSGIIGKVTSVTANLGYRISHVPRLLQPELAGGALLDLGVYPINFASMVLGADVSKVSSNSIITDTGVDSQNGIMLTYEDGSMAVINSTMLAETTKEGAIYGDKGHIIVDNINNFEKIHVYNIKMEEVAVYDQPEQISGFEYQVEAAIRSIQNREMECPQLPHAEMIRIMQLMDNLREEWGVKYPDEITKID